MFLSDDIPKLINLISIDSMMNSKFVETLLFDELKEYRLETNRELFKYDDENIIKNAVKNLNYRFINNMFDLKSNLGEINSEYIKTTNYEKKTKKFKLRDYQIKIINDMKEFYKNNSKGILQLPCGVGKSYIASYYAYKEVQRLQGRCAVQYVKGKILIICPQIMICEEFKNVFSQLKYDRYYIINSDYSTEFNDDIYKQYNVFIITYSSAKLLFAYKFDFIIYDESHHLCASEWSKSIDMNGDKKLFMTATLKYSLYDEKKDEFEEYKLEEDNFGKLIYKLELSYCIENNILCDYMLYYPNEENCNDIILMQKLIEEYKRKRIVLFFNTCENSKLTCMKLNDIGLNCKYIDGNMNLKEKKEIIEWFSNDDEQSKILCNVNIINEGVSICVIDCICFMEERSSKIGIYQNIGRGLRRYDGKDVCMIVCSKNMIDDMDLYNSLFEYDNRMKNSFSKKIMFDRNVDIKKRDGIINEFKLIECKMMTFEDKINLCLEYENTYGLIKDKIVYKNIRIGYFIGHKLNDYKKNKLSQDRLKMLMQLKTFQKRIKENKIRVVRNFNEVYNLCLEYENTTNKLILCGTIYKDVKIGYFISHKINDHKK